MGSASVEELIEEWGEWECPVCESIQDDPDTILVTSCANGHACLLGPIENSGPHIGVHKNHRWAEIYDYKTGRLP